MFYGGLNSEVLLANIDPNEVVLYLCDGSKWQARPMDLKVLAAWQSGQLIRISQSDVDKYPYELTNEDTPGMERIRVRLLDVFLPGDENWIRESGVEARLID